MKRIALTFFYDSFISCRERFFPATLALVTGFSVLVGCSSGQSSDPVVVNQPVVFIERPLLDEEGEAFEDDAREPANFRGGAVLYLKDKATVDTVAIDISSSAFSDASFLNDEGELIYDIRDVSASYDAKKILFSMRAPQLENVDEEDQPTWNIWEYDIELASLRRIFDPSLNVKAEEGHDISPSYLPDGRILFTSTRQSSTKATLLDEGKSGYAGLDEQRNVEAFNLHVMDSDGQDVEQITFNQSHDLDPVILSTGKILFSRWDNVVGVSNNGFNLYEINPDGTGLNYLYGRHSHRSGDEGTTVQYLDPRELDDGRIAVSLREFQIDQPALQPTVIDIENHIDFNTETDGTEHTENMAQIPVVSDLNTAGDQTIKGIFDSFTPLYDDTGRYLVSWSICRVQLIDSDTETDGNQAGVQEACTEENLSSAEYEAAEPLFGLYVYESLTETLKLISVPKQGVRYEEVKLVTERTLPDVIIADDLSSEALALADEGFGIVHIRSVYDFDGIDTSTAGIDVLADPAQTDAVDRPRRFLRVVKPVPIPDDSVLDFDDIAFGVNTDQGLRDILGYVPVEPDGSVKFAVPANLAFSINVLDSDGRRIDARHRSWLQVAPGETLECAGCHTANSTVPHGRNGAGLDPVNQGAVTTGLPFPNTVSSLFADMGETMAQTYARINGTRRLSPDIVFDDEWTDPDTLTSASSFTYAYSDLTTGSPVKGTGCESDWDPICRITINYELHIHPLWSVDRRIFDTDEETVLEDRTCITCHTPTEDVEVLIDTGEPPMEDDTGATEIVAQDRVPDGQLDLTNGPSTDEPNHFKSYRELLFNDNQQTLLNGLLADLMVDSDEVRVDDDGEPVLDDDGNLQFLPTTVIQPRSMNQNGALNSGRFLNQFAAGGTHEGYLSDAELKLISEWLDIGAQYFNNPFDAPLD